MSGRSLTELSGLEMADLLASGAVSSRELVLASLAAADTHGERLGIFITRLDAQALAWAEEADALRRDGDTRRLLGVPYAVKDLHPLAGVPCTMGSSALPATIAVQDSPTVARLRAAGLVAIGTTNACEFGPACFTRTDLAGDARNPWDERMSASGSSGGSAAAVAARVLPWAHASDGAGSIRLPASVCGLVGHKPSRGVSPAQSSSFIDFAVEAALTRSVADARALFEAITLPGHRRLYGHPAAPASNRRLRIAVCVDAGGENPVAAECANAALEAAGLLQAEGHEVHQIGVLLSEAHRAIARSALLDVMSAGIAAATSVAIPADNLELLQPYTRWLRERGMHISGAHLLASQTMLSAVTAAALEAQETYDVLITPTVTRPQVIVDEFCYEQGQQSFDAMAAWAAFAPMANWTGQPAISVPFTTDELGRPIGVQLIGRVGDDLSLLALAEVLELACGFSALKPPMLRRVGAA